MIRSVTNLRRSVLEYNTVRRSESKLILLKLFLSFPQKSVPSGKSVSSFEDPCYWSFGDANVGLPKWYSGKESTCRFKRCKRHRFDAWVRKIHWRRKQQCTPAFFPGKSHGQWSLVGYSPWGLKESDTTEHTHMCYILWTLCQQGLCNPHRIDSIILIICPCFCLTFNIYLLLIVYLSFFEGFMKKLSCNMYSYMTCVDYQFQIRHLSGNVILK